MGAGYPSKMHLDRPNTLLRWAPRALTATLLWLGAAACASTNRYAGMSPEQLHVLGQQEFDQGDYEDAILALDRLLLVFPDYTRVAEARYLMARSYYEDKQYLLASDEFLRFLERHAGHLLAAEAAIGVCRSYVALSPIPARDQNYTRQAFNVCRDVAREYTTSEVATEAAQLAQQMRTKLAEKEFDTGQHYYSRDQLDSAVLYWEALLDEYADTDWAPRALRGIYCSKVKIGYEDEAEEARLQLLNSYPESEEARQARDGGLTC
jgi:outer membrane protein assembly factor BamD